jgi:hypothetical protein
MQHARFKPHAEEHISHMVHAAPSRDLTLRAVQSGDSQMVALETWEICLQFVDNTTRGKRRAARIV